MALASPRAWAVAMVGAVRPVSAVWSVSVVWSVRAHAEQRERRRATRRAAAAPKMRTPRQWPLVVAGVLRERRMTAVAARARLTGARAVRLARLVRQERVTGLRRCAGAPTGLLLPGRLRVSCRLRCCQPCAWRAWHSWLALWRRHTAACIRSAPPCLAAAARPSERGPSGSRVSSVGPPSLWRARRSS